MSASDKLKFLITSLARAAQHVGIVEERIGNTGAQPDSATLVVEARDAEADAREELEKAIDREVEEAKKEPKRTGSGIWRMEI